MSGGKSWVYGTRYSYRWKEHQGPKFVTEALNNDDDDNDENDDHDEIWSLRDRSSLHHSFLRFGLL
jgi:hypothetical protein